MHISYFKLTELNTELMRTIVDAVDKTLKCSFWYQLFFEPILFVLKWPIDTDLIVLCSNTCEYAT